MGRFLTEDDVERAIAGGAVFACGGGGWADHGRMLGAAAVNAGAPELVSIEELDGDAWVATAAAIGAPAGTTDWQMLGVDYVRAVELLQSALDAPVSGLVIGQNGKSSTLNAWLPAAILGCKVIDAVGDIRAHPTGDMGAMGLANSTEPMIQTAVGGNRAAHAYIELTTRGATARVSPVLRTAADQSGGFIASCRNPVRASFIRQHAALGGISRALDLGEAIVAARPKGGAAVIDAICRSVDGAIVTSGKVREISVRYTAEAFDIGTVTVGNDRTSHVLHVMNEYMALDDAHGARLATYPDVIATLDDDGTPVSVGELREDMNVHVLHVHKTKLPLSSSVTDPSVYPVVERALGISIADHALEQGLEERPVMTIHLINPNSSQAVTDAVDAAIDPMRSTTRIDIRCHTLAEGPAGIESQADIESVVQPLLARAAALEHDASAFVIACFSDPGLAALREQSARPVIGIAEAAIMTAMTMGQRFGILSILGRSVPRHLRYIGAMGVNDRLAGDLPLDLGVAELRDEARTFSRMQHTGERLRDDFGAEVLILGCAGMANYRARLEADLGLPVVDPSQAAIGMALGHVAMTRAMAAAVEGGEASR